jgi:hypothetical protein
MRSIRPLLLILALLATTPLFAYTIYLKDGSRLMADGPYRIEGDQAIITLQNGTRTSIAAVEIDEQRTKEANAGGYGSALVLDDGKFTQLEAEQVPEEEESLSERIGGRRRSTAVTRDPVRRPVARKDAPRTLSNGAVDLRSLPRTPFSDLELAAEMQRVFRAHGVEQVMISQGTDNGRLLVDITANSEASIFRSLEAAASALLHAREAYPDASAVFEILLTTASREPGGQFVLTQPLAQLLADGQIETSTFFIENVVF